MFQRILSDTALYAAQLRFDKDIAEEARKKQCPICGGPLHQANYMRAPLGVPGTLPDEYSMRFSYCCGREGCRKRLTPPSLRFFGRRLYSSVVVVLFSALRCGISQRRAEALRASIDVSYQTLQRWRTWWLETFPQTHFWKAVRGRLARPPDTPDLPAALWECFTGPSPLDRLLRLLRFLSPLSAGTHWPKEA
jgi:hypothetical protein